MASWNDGAQVIFALDLQNLVLGAQLPLLNLYATQTDNFVGRVYDGHQHGDLGVLPDGVTEFFMTFELYHPSGNLAIGYCELPGTATVSDPAYVRVMDWLGDHISCQGPHGVCLVTTIGDDRNGWSALEGELFL